MYRRVRHHSFLYRFLLTVFSPLYIDGTPAQLKALNSLKFDLQVKSELNEPEVQKNFKLGNSKHKDTRQQ